MHTKTSSAKWRQFCPGRVELISSSDEAGIHQINQVATDALLHVSPGCKLFQPSASEPGTFSLDLK